LAVPIRNSGGTVIAALNVSVHASRATMAVAKRDFLPLALRTAAAIEEDVMGSSDRRASGR
jgi:IclR family pca regulon transcriptional regulator